MCSMSIQSLTTKPLNPHSRRSTSVISQRLLWHGVPLSSLCDGITVAAPASTPALNGGKKVVRNVRSPAPENYIGRRPLSEPESALLYRFTLEVRPDATISYHTKGEEIYWEYFQQGERLRRDEALALALAKETGYAAKRISGSGGGYKDACIRALRIPAFTIEAGRDSLSHPLSERDFPDILAKNIGAVRRLSEELWKIR